MAKQLEQFPAEIRENLLDGAQQIFVTAYNSAIEDGLSEEAATQVAWNSLHPNYEQGPDGKWHIRANEPGIHGKAITTGGN